MGVKSLVLKTQKGVHPKEGVIGLAPEGHASELLVPDTARAALEQAVIHREGAQVLVFQLSDQWIHV
jgi:hypothetical protein